MHVKGLHLYLGDSRHHQCGKTMASFLLGTFFIIQTDHKSLKELLNYSGCANSKATVLLH